MEKKYIIETNYFKNPVTWVLRTIQSLVALTILFWIDLQDLSQKEDLLWMGYVFAGILVIAFFVRPVDDLALDQDKLYFIKKSVFTFLNRETEYNISHIEKIKVGGIYNINGTFALLDPRGNRNRVEIHFKNNSSKSYDLNIFKKELKNIALKVTELVNHNRK